MGHRDSVGTPHMFENDHDQSRNVHGEQTYGHIARGTTGENGSFFYTVENGCPEGAQFTSHWNSAPRSNGFIPIGHNDQLQPCQPDPPGPTQESFMLRSSMGTFGSVPENYFPQASSSSYDRQAPYAVEGGGFAEIAMGSGRAHQKRKSPGIPSVCERGNTSRYYSGGPSSEVPAFSDLRQDLLAVGAPHMPWDHLAANNPGYRGNSLSVRAEGSLRNVRSRAGICLEANSLWSHIDSPPLSSFIPSQPVEHSSLLDIPGPSSNALTTDWSHVNISSAQGRVLLPDPHGFSHESTHFLGGSNPSIALPDTREYDFMTSRNPVVPQLHHHGSSNQSVRGPCNSYSHRSTPAFRPLNSTRLGTANPLEEGIRPVTENFSRHPRLPSATGWRNNDRNRRSRIATERYRSVPNEAAVHDRMGYEGLSVVDRSALYASRSAIDQHRDLRLDIDNMSYEELLALGERIGAVSTGLSGDSISKCLKETAYCPREDQMEDTERCAICLEAYGEADGVGTLKTCGHHYHAHCIRRWLSMKNSCPICKACALADDVKDSP